MAMDLKAAPVTLRFGSDTQQDEFKLFELDESVLAEIQASTTRGHDLVEIRGPSNKDAVLVTGNRSYSVKLVETSNTMMLVADEKSVNNMKEALSTQPPVASQGNGIKKARLDMDGTAKSSEVKDDSSSTDRLIIGTISCHYELVEIMPRISELRDLLAASIWEYNNDEEALAVEAKLAGGAGAVKYYSTKELQLMIQASNTQLFAALDHEDAFQLRGVWRKVPFTVLSQCMKNFKLIFEANDPAWRTAIPGQQYIDEMRSLAEYPDEIYFHFLRLITQRRDNDARFTVNEAIQLTYVVDQKKWALYHAEALFRMQNPIAWAEFATEWQTLCEWITPDVAWLKGFAIVEENTALLVAPDEPSGGEEKKETGKRDIRQWRYFDVRHMSFDATARFAELFRLRPQWTKDDILPYIGGLSLQSTDEILLKNTRMIRKGDGFIYIRR